MSHWPKGLFQVAPRWRNWSHTTKFDRDGCNNPPLVGGLCLIQQTSTTEGLKICPLSGDFVSFNGLRPRRASRICPSSEDFVSFNGLRPRGVSETAPHWRTLSRATDFDQVGPQDLPLIGGLCLVNGIWPKQTGPGQQNRTSQREQCQCRKPKDWASERKNCVVFTWRRWKILHRTLGRCYGGGLCVLAMSSGSMKKL